MIHHLRHVAIASALFVLPVSAHADPVSDAACKTFGDLAEQVMRARQADRPMSELMNLVGGAGDDGGLARKLIIEAYSKPAYHSEPNQKRAIAEFRNSVELVCFSKK